jgi:hypothetical protein
MRTTFRVLLVAGALAAFAGFASSITVETKSSPGVDFSRYKSYSVADMPEVKNPAVRQRLESALDKQLKAKGLERKDSGGDLRVMMHPRISKEYNSSDYDTSWDYGWGNWASIRDLSGDSSSSKRLEGVPVGTVIVDLVDAATKQLAWRGGATSVLNAEDSDEKRQDVLDDAMKKLFAKYPRLKKN